MNPSVTRLAPSPTGALHLGNLRTFLLNVLLARSRGWKTLMRIEDLDSPRVKPQSARDLLDQLTWLGLSWDSQPIYQSTRTELYEEALERLVRAGWAYPCVCTRKDVEAAASAPHVEDALGAYPGTCRGRFTCLADAFDQTGREAAWRLRVPDEPIRLVDEFAGALTYNLAETCGDFVIYKKDRTASYQLAVVVDDAASGVDAVVRGDDLLDSTPRQIHLRRLLGLVPEPRYWHLPLVVGPDGRRLAKRHGDTRLGKYRREGTSPQRLLGLLGWWSGLLERRRPADMDELLARFDPEKVPRRPVTFRAEDEAFLLEP
jgi:glutamyl-tRNA synthetase